MSTDAAWVNEGIASMFRRLSVMTNEDWRRHVFSLVREVGFHSGSRLDWPDCGRLTDEFVDGFRESFSDAETGD